VLKRMKRRHTRDDTLRFVDAVRAVRPDVAFGADLIAGFPTETDAQFADTLKLVDEADLAFLHVFPYSPRAGTPAARMPQVPGPVRKDRAAQLRAAGERRLAAMLDNHVGTTADVLVEQPRIGRTPHYAMVDLDRDVAPGSVVRADLIAAGIGRLVGRIADRAAA